jgi:hypothetical protein
MGIKNHTKIIVTVSFSGKIGTVSVVFYTDTNFSASPKWVKTADPPLAI